MGLIFIKTIKIFEYEKNNNKYWNKTKLYKQVVKKILSITKVFYLKYLLYFLFDNATSHSIYTKNIF